MSAISDIARENSLKILGVTLICNLSASDHTRGEKPRLYIAWNKFKIYKQYKLL